MNMMILSHHILCHQRSLVLLLGYDQFYGKLTIDISCFLFQFILSNGMVYLKISRFNLSWKQNMNQNWNHTICTLSAITITQIQISLPIVILGRLFNLFIDQGIWKSTWFCWDMGWTETLRLRKEGDLEVSIRQTDR